MCLTVAAVPEASRPARRRDSFQALPKPSPARPFSVLHSASRQLRTSATGFAGATPGGDVMNASNTSAGGPVSPLLPPKSRPVDAHPPCITFAPSVLQCVDAAWQLAPKEPFPSSVSLIAPQPAHLLLALLQHPAAGRLRDHLVNTGVNLQDLQLVLQAGLHQQRLQERAAVEQQVVHELPNPLPPDGRAQLPYRTMAVLHAALDSAMLNGSDMVDLHHLRNALCSHTASLDITHNPLGFALSHLQGLKAADEVQQGFLSVHLPPSPSPTSHLSNTGHQPPATAAHKLLSRAVAHMQSLADMAAVLDAYKQLGHRPDCSTRARMWGMLSTAQPDSFSKLSRKEVVAVLQAVCFAPALMPQPAQSDDLEVRTTLSPEHCLFHLGKQCGAAEPTEHYWNLGPLDYKISTDRLWKALSWPELVQVMQCLAALGKLPYPGAYNEEHGSSSCSRINYDRYIQNELLDSLTNSAARNVAEVMLQVLASSSRTALPEHELRAVAVMLIDAYKVSEAIRTSPHHYRVSAQAAVVALLLQGSAAKYRYPQRVGAAVQLLLNSDEAVRRALSNECWAWLLHGDMQGVPVRDQLRLWAEYCRLTVPSDIGSFHLPSLSFHSSTSSRDATQPATTTRSSIYTVTDPQLQFMAHQSVASSLQQEQLDQAAQLTHRMKQLVMPGPTITSQVCAAIDTLLHQAAHAELPNQQLQQYTDLLCVHQSWGCAQQPSPRTKAPQPTGPASHGSGIAADSYAAGEASDIQQVQQQVQLGVVQHMLAMQALCSLPQPEPATAKVVDVLGQLERLATSKESDNSALIALCVLAPPNTITNLTDMAACLSAAYRYAHRLPHRLPGYHDAAQLPALPLPISLWVKKARLAVARLLWQATQQPLPSDDETRQQLAAGMTRCLTALVALGAEPLALGTIPATLLTAVPEFASPAGLWSLSAMWAPHHSAPLPPLAVDSVQQLGTKLRPTSSAREVKRDVLCLLATACQLQAHCAEQAAWQHQPGTLQQLHAISTAACLQYLSCQDIAQLLDSEQLMVAADLSLQLFCNSLSHAAAAAAANGTAAAPATTPSPASALHVVLAEMEQRLEGDLTECSASEDDNTSSSNLGTAPS